jgi:hypothetical protein
MWSLLQCLVNLRAQDRVVALTTMDSANAAVAALPAQGSTCCSAIDRHRTVAEAQTPFLVTVARYFLVDVAVLVCASARRQVAGLAKNADARHKGIAWAADGIWRDVSEKAVFRRIG